MLSQQVVPKLIWNLQMQNKNNHYTNVLKHHRSAETSWSVWDLTFDEKWQINDTRASLISCCHKHTMITEVHHTCVNNVTQSCDYLLLHNKYPAISHSFMTCYAMIKIFVLLFFYSFKLFMYSWRLYHSVLQYHPYMDTNILNASALCNSFPENPAFSHCSSLSNLLERCNPWPHVANHAPTRAAGTGFSRPAPLIMTSFSLWRHSLLSWPRPPLRTDGRTDRQWTP